MSILSRKAGIASLCVAAMLGATGIGFAADRVVLGEFITSETCTSCIAAAPTVSAMVDDYPEFAFIGIHFGDQYQTPWGFDRATAFYGPMGFSTPFFVFDGVDAPGDPGLYELEYLSHTLMTTDVTIDLSAAAAGGASTFDVTAHVCVESGGQGKTMRIYMVEVLDNYPASSHFPRNGFRQATATEDIVLSASGCDDVVKTITFDATSSAQPENIRIIAWAQAASVTGPAQVYQAAILPGPFDGGDLIFSDGFESGDLGAWN